MPPSVNSLICDLQETRCHQPFHILGWHKKDDGSGVTLRGWYPDAVSVSVIHESSKENLGQMAERVAGLFEMSLPSTQAPFLYRLSIKSSQEKVITYIDPYQFRDFCLGNGDKAVEPHQQHNYFGARLVEYLSRQGECVKGVMFRVYAPGARSVSVVGSFNGWDGRYHPMEKSTDGIWKLFIPDVDEGVLYKYEIRDGDGQLLPHKADPFGYHAEQPPGNASIVYNHDRYQWCDQQWKHHAGLDRPMSIYEVHLGSWKRKDDQWLSYLELADDLVPYVKKMGFTHVEFLPVMEHPFYGSWGYQPVGLFAPTSRYGSPDDFKALIDRFHQAGIGVILDWVPAHFPADSHGLANFDGTPLYEYGDPKRGWHPDWHTHIFDYSKAEARNFLVSNALFWLEYFHLDGLRVDAVASMLYLDYSRKDGEWEPNLLGGNEHLEAVQFLKELNESLYLNYPDRMTIAEDSSSWPGVSFPTYDCGLGFGYKWNMGWMNDSLEYMKKDPIYRKFHHDEFMLSMTYFYDEHFILPLSHDEVVYGKGTLISRMPGDEWQRYANLRAYLGYMFGHPGKKLLFMGSELGSGREWNHDEQLDWGLLANNFFSRGIQQLVVDLNEIYKMHPALWHQDYDQAGFEWLIIDDREQSVFAFFRHSFDEQAVVVISNMTPVARKNYRVGVPVAGVWAELLNTDASVYGGSNLINRNIQSQSIPAHWQHQSVELVLPPLATIFLMINIEK